MFSGPYTLPYSENPSMPISKPVNIIEKYWLSILRSIFNNLPINSIRILRPKITKIIKSIVKENHSTITSLEINDTENGNIKIDLCITVDSDNDNLSNEMMQKLLNKKEVLSISLNKKDKRFLFEEEEL